MKCLAASILIAIAVPMAAQIPSVEDLETKSKREPVQEGLEMREVRESTAKDIGEALSRLDGINLLRKGAIANDVVLRGFQGANVTLLIDGARIYGACPGHMDPSAFHVDFAEVERVEVTKGAFDITNQGALGGSVNVIRKRPGSGFHVTPSFNIGSFGYYNPSLTASYGNDEFEILGGYSYRISEPFRDGRGNLMTSVANYNPAAVMDSAFAIHTGWTNIRFSPRHNQSGEIGYTHQDGSGVLYPYLQMDSPYDRADRANFNYTLLELPGAIQALRFESYYSRVNHWMTDEKRLSAVGALDVFSMGSYANTRASGGRVQADFGKNFVAGFETYQRNWNAVNSMRTRMMVTDQNIIPNVNSTVFGFYAEYNKSLSDRLRIGAGARVDTADIYARNTAVGPALYLAYHGVSDLSRRDTNPSANAHIAYGINSSLELFAGVGSTMRLPDAQERLFAQKRMGSDWVGNPGLNPTRNSEVTAGLTFRRKSLYIKPLMYYSHLSDFITVYNQARLSMQPGVMSMMARTYENIDARMYGGELSYGASLTSRWMLSGGLGFTRASKNADPVHGIFSTSFAEIPPLKGRTAIRYGRKMWFAEAEGIAAAAQTRVDTDLREAPSAGYGLLNLKAGLHWGKVTFTGGADNVFNHYYIQFLSYQRDPFRNGSRIAEPGRNVFLNMSYSF